MRDKWEKLANFLLVVAAVTVAAVLVHREFFVAPVAQAAAPSGPRFVKDWRDILPASRLVGSAAARVTIVEFVDMQCPFCGRFHQTLSRALDKHSDRVAYAFVHLPLPSHPHAAPAARAVECAYAQGVFKPFLDAVFENQDSIGKKSWTSYARKAGIPDTARFNRCSRDTVALSIVDAGVELAAKHDVQGTPTILVNGWMYRAALSEAQLDRAISRLLEGKEPR